MVLTGRGRDGAEGVRAIKARGGRVRAQDPATAQARPMPEAAIGTGCVDFVLPPEGLAAALVTLVMVPGAAAWLPPKPPAAPRPSDGSGWRLRAAPALDTAARLR